MTLYSMASSANAHLTCILQQPKHRTTFLPFLSSNTTWWWYVVASVISLFLILFDCQTQCQSKLNNSDIFSCLPKCDHHQLFFNCKCRLISMAVYSFAAFHSSFTTADICMDFKKKNRNIPNNFYSYCKPIVSQNALWTYLKFEIDPNIVYCHMAICSKLMPCRTVSLCTVRANHWLSTVGDLSAKVKTPYYHLFRA